jgi:hypothetical protein
VKYCHWRPPHCMVIVSQFCFSLITHSAVFFLRSIYLYPICNVCYLLKNASVYTWLVIKYTILRGIQMLTTVFKRAPVDHILSQLKFIHTTVIPYVENNFYLHLQCTYVSQWPFGIRFPINLCIYVSSHPSLFRVLKGIFHVKTSEHPQLRNLFRKFFKNILFYFSRRYCNLK